jgi:2-amino-4-hydroxy-6-hydroxymethyldihydropteridine diphosphokinase
LNATAPVEHRVYIGIGSNINPQKNIPLALDLLRGAVKILAVSTAWQNPAIGSDGPDFINAAVLIETAIPPAELKNGILRQIESQLGRVRTPYRNAPRPIDLDILMVDGVVQDEAVWKRPHLAVPLSELVPDYPHPGTGETLVAIAKQLANPTRMYPRPDILQRSSMNLLD